MTDRIHPKASNGKANTDGDGDGDGNINPTANASFPSTKAQLYGASRPTYRPQPQNGRRRGRCSCCSICIWITAIVVFLLVLLAIAATVVYLVYRPHRPSFSVTALKVSSFKLTPSSQLNSKLDLTIAADNPNKKVKFIYNPISVALSSNGIDVGDGSFPEFVHEKKNTTVMKVAVTNSGGELDEESVSSLKSAIKGKIGLPLEIKLDTKVKVKMGWLKTPKVGLRVSCDGITAGVPTSAKKAAAASVVSNAECKVDFRVKIWKWTI